MLEPKYAPEMTPQQRQAIAKAKARLRLQQQGVQPQTSPQAPDRGGGFDMAPSSPAARRDMLTPKPAPAPMAAAPGAQYSFQPTPEMVATASMRAKAQATAEEQQAQGRIPLATDQGTTYVANPAKEMGDTATLRREAEERREASRGYGAGMDMLITHNERGQLAPGTDLDRDLGKGITSLPVRAVNAASNVAQSALNLPGDAYQSIRGGERVIPRVDLPEVPIPQELESNTGQISQFALQYLIGRGLIGKAAPGGGMGAHATKDALTLFGAFDSDTQRLSETLAADFMRDNGLGFMAARDPNNPLGERLKNAFEELMISYLPVKAAQVTPKIVDTVTGVRPQAVTPTNAGGTAVQAARQGQPQPSVAPVAGPTVSQGPGRTAQSGTPGAGQQAPGGPATLQGVQTTPPVSKQQALIDRDTIKITRRIMRSAGIKDADVMGYLPGAVKRFESLNDPRIPLAFFLKSDLPKHFPEEVANRVSTNLDVWGRARNAETGVNDTSRATINKTINDLRKTQQEFLTQSAERNLFKGALLTQEDQILASLRETGRKGYEPVLDNARQAVDGRRAPTPNEAAAIQELRDVLADPLMVGYVDDATRIRAKKDGVDIDQMLKDDPVGSAHWLQSEFRRLADAAEDPLTGKATRMSQVYDDLRDMVLDPLKRAAPGYEGAMNRYGHQFGAKEAVRFGKGIFTAGRSAYETGRTVRRFKQLGRRQQTVAWKSIRDEYLNEFRGTAEDAAAKVTRMQQEGSLDILEQLGPRGKRFADDIRSIAQVENPNLRAIEQASGSPTYSNQKGGANAVDMVQSPVNQAIGAFGQKGSLPTTMLGDAALFASGLPPVLTLGKGVTWTIDRFGNPSKKVLARATEGLYGLPKTKAAPPPPPSKKAGSRGSAAALEAEEAEDMAELLRALDQTEKNPKTRGGRKGQVLLNKIDAASKAPPPPSKKTAKPPQSNASPTGTGIVVGGIGGAMADQEDPARGFAIGATGLGTVGAIGGKLAKAGSGPKAPPKVRAPVGGKGAAPAPAKPSATVSSVPQSRTVAKVTTADGRGYEVTADVIKDRDAVVMSPAWPSNIAEDLTNAIVHQRSRNRARASGMDLANDPPRSPDWAEQNPQEWASVQKQVGERFLGMARSTPGDAHILALVDGVDVNSLGSFLEANLPAGKRLLISPANGEIAIVSKGAKAPQFETWANLSPRYNQSMGLLPPPAEWATSAAAKTPPSGNVKPIAPKPPTKPERMGMGGVSPDFAVGGAAGLMASMQPAKDANGDGVIDEFERGAPGASGVMSGIATGLLVNRGRRMLGNKLKGGPKAPPGAKSQGFGASPAKAGSWRYNGRPLNPFDAKTADRIAERSGGQLSPTEVDELLPVYAQSLEDGMTPAEIRREASGFDLQRPEDLKFMQLATLLDGELTPFRAPKPPPSQMGFTGGKGTKPPPKEPRPVMGKRTINALNQAARSLPPEVRNKLKANAALPPGARKSAAEATGDDPSIYRTAAPFQNVRGSMVDRAKARVRGPSGKPVLPPRGNPIDAGISQGIKRVEGVGPPKSLEPIAEVAGAAEKRRRAAVSEATRWNVKTNTQTREAMGLPELPLPKSLARNEQEATELAIAARRALAAAKLEATSAAEAQAWAAQRKAAILDELMKPIKSGNKPAKPVSYQEAQDMADLMFDAEYAKLLDDVLSGKVKPRNRDQHHMALIAASGATAAGIGALAVANDFASRRQPPPQETAEDPQAYMDPGDPRYVWDWEKVKTNRRAVQAIQINLNALPPNQDGGRYNLSIDTWGPKTEAALKNWQFRNGFNPNGVMTAEQWVLLDQQALQSRRTGQDRTAQRR